MTSYFIIADYNWKKEREPRTQFRTSRVFNGSDYSGQSQLKTSCHNQLCIIETYEDRGIMISHTRKLGYRSFSTGPSE